jgi:histidinol-phosphate aminotransferase
MHRSFAEEFLMNNAINRRHVLLWSAAAGAVPSLASAKSRAGATPVFPIRIGSNENPYGPGPLARAALAAATDQASRYPARQAAELTEKLQQHEQVGKGQIVLGTGSGELLNTLAVAFCERGELVCAWPTFEFIVSYAAKLGAEVRKIPLDAQLGHDLPAMAAPTTANTSIVYVCNPNNPTGTAIPGATLRNFCREQAQRSLVVVDEAYMDLTAPGATESMVDLVREGLNVVILRTFSKIHGLAGLRVGYAVARPDVAARLRRFGTTIPNTLSLSAASASMDDSQFLAASRKALLEDRARLTAMFDELGVRYAQPNGNFVFVQTGRPAAEFSKALQAERIEIGRPYELYPDWARITIGTRTEMDYVLPVLRRIMRT